MPSLRPCRRPCLRPCPCPCRPLCLRPRHQPRRRPQRQLPPQPQRQPPHQPRPLSRPPPPPWLPSSLRQQPSPASSRRRPCPCAPSRLAQQAPPRQRAPRPQLAPRPQPAPRSLQSLPPPLSSLQPNPRSAQLLPPPLVQTQPGNRPPWIRLHQQGLAAALWKSRGRHTALQGQWPSSTPREAARWPRAGGAGTGIAPSWANSEGPRLGNSTPSGASEVWTFELDSFLMQFFPRPSKHATHPQTLTHIASTQTSGHNLT